MATHYGENRRQELSESSMTWREPDLEHILSEVNRLSAMLDDISRRRKLEHMQEQTWKNSPKQHPLIPVSFERGRAEMARRLYKERRFREEFFASTLFHDPAWDMLLDLYVAYYKRKNVGISSLCIASCVPATTALRWISTMEDAGLFKRSSDPNDGRRIFVALTDGAKIGMDAYFDKLAEVWKDPYLI